MAGLTLHPGVRLRAEGRRRIPPRLAAAGRIAAGLAVVAATAAAVGGGAFVRGIASVSPVAVGLAAVLVCIATAAATWRWRVVAAGLGVPLPWRAAFAAYYRSQFLNAVLPGGVLGDAHRAYAHGRSTDRVDASVRAVAAERVAGQIVQVVVTLAILLPLGFASALAPVEWSLGLLVAALLAVIAAVAIFPRGRRFLAREVGMLRPLVARPTALLAVIVASILVVGAHVSTFIVAALAVGVPLGPGHLASIALVVLSAAAVPLNVGGWGPREAASAGVFALAGVGGSVGLEVSVAFGVLALVAVAPGALVLVGDRIRSHRERLNA